MCIGVPARIIRMLPDHLAEAEYHGNRLTLEMGLIDAAPGDYVLVHAGTAIERIRPEEALQIQEMLAELMVVMGQEPLPPDNLLSVERSVLETPGNQQSAADDGTDSAQTASGGGAPGRTPRTEGR